MSIDQLASLYEAGGHHVVRCGRNYWYSASPRIYQNLPPSEPVSPTSREVDELFRSSKLTGIQFPTELSTGILCGRFVLSDKAYSLASAQPQFRQHVRKGLQKCTVREIGFDELRKIGMPVNLDAMRRREYAVPCFVDPKLWANFCIAGEKIEGAGAIGSFVSGTLAAYLIYAVISGTCYGLHMMSRFDMRAHKPNHCLYFTFADKMINRSDLEMVTTGLHSLHKTRGIDDFKRHAGFKLETCNVGVVLRPSARMLLANPVSRLSLAGASRLLKKPHLDRLHQVVQIATKTVLS